MPDFQFPLYIRGSKHVSNRRGVQRAIKSLKLYPLPVRTEAEACALEGVGSFTARRMLRSLGAPGLAAAGKQSDRENIEPPNLEASSSASSTDTRHDAPHRQQQQPHVGARALGSDDANDQLAGDTPCQARLAGSRFFRVPPLSLASNVSALREERGGRDAGSSGQATDVTPRRPTSRARREEIPVNEPEGIDREAELTSSRAPREFRGDWEAFLLVDNREHEHMSVQVR